VFEIVVVGPGLLLLLRRSLGVSLPRGEMLVGFQGVGYEFW
jgi:hypothetical protein